MEKAYKLQFKPEYEGGLGVNFCGCSQTGPLHSFGPAVKPHYLIHYIMSGRGKFSMHGQEYPLEKGRGFLICPDEAVFYQADEKDPWTYIWVGFDGGLASKYLSHIGLSLQNPIFKCDDSDKLYQAVLDMMEHNTFSVSDELRRNGQLGIFLSVIAENVPMVRQNDKDRANHYVRKAVEFIQSNYCNPIKVTDVADYVCINRSYLYTLFQNFTGMSPQRFMTMFRMTKASELLRLTDLTIESIALSCGYNDSLVFTKAFHQMKNMSPTAYRKITAEGEHVKDKEELMKMEEILKQIEKLSGGENHKI
jgi:AraC family transcriptional regulator of arabinose operon